MIKAELANEFTATDPNTGKPTTEHIAREKAFRNFNKLVQESPEHVARVMSIMAIEAALDKEDEPIADVAEHVLSVTNRGTSIGFDEVSRERLWGEIFEDPWHYNANRNYIEALREHGKDSTEAQRLSRIRGFYTLRIFAEQQAAEEHQQLETAA